jgi:hypothetical protein
MRYSFVALVLLLVCVCVGCGADPVVGEIKQEMSVIEMLQGRLPGYVASLPRLVEDVDAVPYRWVGYIHAREREKKSTINTGDFTGCAFGHPRVVLTAAHGFFYPQTKGYVFDFFWSPRYSYPERIPQKLEVCKIRKVIINNGPEGFAYHDKNKKNSSDVVDEDIACAILYDAPSTDPNDYAQAYPVDKVADAITSTRKKMSAAYFVTDHLYGYNGLGSNPAKFLMRSTPVITRPYIKHPIYKHIYETQSAKFVDMQQPDASQTFIMTSGCSGAPIFIADDDDAWKVAMVHIGQFPDSGAILEGKITNFLNDSENRHQSNYLKTTATVLDQSFYDIIWAEVQSILRDDEHVSGHVITPQ